MLLPWRLALPQDDNAIAAMAVALSIEDAFDLTNPMSPEQAKQTLHLMRQQPNRGNAWVLQPQVEAIGYALLVAFWSNEMGGEICIVDELYVQPQARQQGHGSALMAALVGRKLQPWQSHVAVELEVSPKNTRARALYERQGFTAKRNHHLRLRMPARKMT